MGNYCRLHGFVCVAPGWSLGDFVFIYKFVAMTDGPWPPSDNTVGGTIGNESILKKLLSGACRQRLEEESLLEGRNPAPGAHHVEQKNAPKSFQELMEVHRRSTQDGIERIAGNALQAVALQPMFRLQMSDAGLDRGATLHPSPECSRRPASCSFVHMHHCSARVVVAAIAHVHMHLADPLPDHALDLLHLLGQCVAIVGVARVTLCADEPSTVTAHRDTHLVAELILL